MFKIATLFGNRGQTNEKLANRNEVFELVLLPLEFLS